MNSLLYFFGCQYLIGISLERITYQFCCDRIVSDDQKPSIAKLMVIVYHCFQVASVASGDEHGDALLFDTFDAVHDQPQPDQSIIDRVAFG